MTTAKAINFQGTLFKVGNGASPEVFDTVAELKSINLGSGSAAILDATTTESEAKEKLMGLPDEGQATFDLNFDPTDTDGQEALRAARADRSLLNYKVVFTTGDTAAFSGYVTSMPVAGQVDQIITRNVTIEITGPIVWS